MAKKDKRRSPRVAARMPIRVTAKGTAGAIDARTLNLSYDGAYCRIGRFIPLNSKVDVKLDLLGSEIPCKGIVVRNKKGEDKDQYGLAIFFTSCPITGKKKIIEFIDSRLSEAGIKTRASRKKVREFVDYTGYVSKGKGLEISSANFRVLEGDMVINSKGLSCQTDRRVPLFKEIGVNVVIPGKRGKDEAIQCNGIAVSCNKVRGKDRYDLAIYFEDLSQDDKAKIDSFATSGKKAKSPA